MEDTKLQNHYINSSILQNALDEFKNVISKIQKTDWKKFLQQIGKYYNIEIYNTQKLCPQRVLEIYSTILKKFYTQKMKKQYWYQNELKIFIWTLLNYSNLIKKLPENFMHQDWQFLSNLFVGKTAEMCQFQFLNIKKSQKKRQRWPNQEDALLKNIIKDLQFTNKWNEIAKELFIRSNKLYFRTAKHCRERWNNYLDPQKTKGNWTLQEDKTLVKAILQKGKKWAYIAKLLNNRRTQHTVKNRYKSLLMKQQKNKNSELSNENQIFQQIYKKLEQIKSNEDYKNQDSKSQSSKINKTYSNIDSSIIKEDQDIEPIQQQLFKNHNKQVSLHKFLQDYSTIKQSGFLTKDNLDNILYTHEPALQDQDKQIQYDYSFRCNQS